MHMTSLSNAGVNGQVMSTCLASTILTLERHDLRQDDEMQQRRLAIEHVHMCTYM
jgi:hypothetical protein